MKLSHPVVSAHLFALIRAKNLHRQAVVLHDLSQGFDGQVLFDNLNLQVEAEERVAILGPNGIGKTTLLRTLMGELTPMHGHVKLD